MRQRGRQTADPGPELLLTRIRAVLESHRARTLHEAGATYAFRAALVDLAAVSESLAADLVQGRPNGG